MPNLRRPNPPGLAPAAATHLILLLVVVSICTLAAPAALADWSPIGIPIAQGVLDHQHHHDIIESVGAAICSDGDGGLICAWVVDGSDLQINRLRASDGTRQWNGTLGVSVTQFAGDPGNRPPHVVQDRARGAWVVWRDARTGAEGVYVQRYDHDGNPQLAVGGQLVISSTNYPHGVRDLDVDVTPLGHLVMAWSTGAGVNVQRLDASGAGQLTPGGVMASTDALVLRVYVLAYNNDVVVAWQPIFKIRANHVSSAGVTQWGANGIPVLDNPDPLTQASVVNLEPSYNGGLVDGFLVSWAHYNHGLRPNLVDVHVQKIATAGGLLWGPVGSGTIALLAPNTAYDQFDSIEQTTPGVASDHAGGAVLAWADYRDYLRFGPSGQHLVDIYGQRVDASGAALWSATGAPLDTTQGSQWQPRVVDDEGDGAIVLFEDRSISVGWKAKALHADGAGADADWNVFLTVANDFHQQRITAVSDGAGGFLAAWESNENDPPDGLDVYGTHRDGNGVAFGPSLSVAVPNGGEVYASFDTQPIEWTSNITQDVKLQYSVGAGPPIMIDPSTANDGAGTWTVPNLNTTEARVRVSDAFDDAPDDSSDNYFTICPMFTNIGTTTSGSDSEDIVAGDFNKDGIMDLAVSSAEAGNQVSVLMGQGAGGVGNGTFKFAYYTAGTAPRSLVTEDFDEDGILDLAVTVTAGVAVMLGNGAGTFSLDSTYAAGTNPHGIVAADFNEDGILDLAVTAGVDDAASILIGGGSAWVGDGTFAAPVQYSVGDAPVRLVVADFIDDGILDLAVVNNGVDNSVSILKGRGNNGVGNGTFQSGAVVFVGLNPWGIAVGDFDRDEIEDLAVANTTSNNLAILTGNGTTPIGDGTFSISAPVPAGTGPLEIETGDFNVDGFPDLIVSNASQDRLSVIFNDRLSPGSFFFGVDYLVGNEPRGLVVGDFLEDTFPDVMSADETGSTASLLTSGCAGTPATTILVLEANGGEQWNIGSEQLVRWMPSPGVMDVDIELSRDGGATWEPLRRHQIGRLFAWTVTGPPTTEALIRVSDPDAPGRTDVSSATFEIVDPAIGIGKRPPAVPAALLGPAYPNPSSGAVFIELNAPTAVDAQVDVYDAAGRHVTTLYHGGITKGSQLLRWNGLDARGRRTPSGIYFVRAVWPGFSAHRKLVLLR